MKKLLTIAICIMAGVLMMNIIMDKCYVELLDAIGAHNNVRVERLLKLPFKTLDKRSAHIPFRWFRGLGENVSPLEQACMTGNYKAAKLLIEKGADASIVHEGTFSPIYFTMSETDKNDYELIKLLVSNGADPSADVEIVGESSLVTCARMDCSDYDYNEYRARYEHTDWDKERAFSARYDEKKAKMIVNIYKYLEEKDESKLVLYQGITPLQIAVGSQNIALIKYILENNIFGINDKDESGTTCIFSISNVENMDYDHEWKKKTFDLLMEYGADPNIKNNEGKTVYDYAAEEGDDYLMKLLEPYMDQ